MDTSKESSSCTTFKQTQTEMSYLASRQRRQLDKLHTPQKNWGLPEDDIYNIVVTRNSMVQLVVHENKTGQEATPPVASSGSQQQQQQKEV